MMLTNPTVLSNTNPVIAKSMTGTGISLKHGRIGAHSMRFFYANSSMVGCVGAFRDAQLLVHCHASLMQPATNLTGINGDGFLTKHEYTIMALINPYPVDEVITPVDRALSVISLLQISSEHQQLNIQGVTAQNLLWVVQNELEAAQQANDSWSRLGEGE